MAQPLNKKRRSIPKRIQAIVMFLSIASIMFISAIGTASMIKIKNISQNILTFRLMYGMSNMVNGKAEVANLQFTKYVEYLRIFAEYINKIYTDNNPSLGKEVLPPLKTTKMGEYSMQRSLASKDVKLSDIQNEMLLLSNLENMFIPVMNNNKNIIAAIYACTESGLMISYDNWAANAALNNNQEVYYEYRQKDWYIEPKQSNKVYFSSIYEDGFGRGLTITCSTPFYDSEGDFKGTVCMDILINDLYNELISTDLDPSAYAFIVDDKGYLISKNTPNKSIYEDKDIDINISKNIINKHRDIELSKTNIYYAYAPIPITNWSLCIRAPQNIILESVLKMNSSIILSIAIFLTIFVFTTIIVIITGRGLTISITHPLIALENDVKKISGGNLDHKATVYVNDEIGDLATSFNEMAVSLKKYIEDLTSVTAEKERIGIELEVATRIQADMLPSTFPPFPDRTEFDIYATMTPAKEVGGDFYDFFFINKDNLAIVIADVAGKGVPAALFMVITKTLIKNRALMGGTPAEILGHVNNQLCEGNKSELFVTVWLGLLNIPTGKLISANAGHEYPALRRKGEGFTLIKSEHCPPLAALEDLSYDENELQLNSGDCLFLYTDGVAEAKNDKKERFGTDRLIQILNKDIKSSSTEQLITVKNEIKDFAGSAPQYDDITMLSLTYLGKQ